jgi:hypothetical protein
MRIPYGRSDFGDIRRRGMFYADKTPFLPALESDEAGHAYVIFLRPRRFGKSTLIRMLEHYYDLAYAGEHDELFRGLWIHEHPTPERNSYLVLTLDFSPVSTGGDAETIRQSFATVVKGAVRPFISRYRSVLPALVRLEEHLEGYKDAGDLLTTLLSFIAGSGHKLYLLIDEYDHFANRLLADGAERLYESIVRGTGFVRSFYSTLKAGTATGALGRMFITGVSPILLDDLSSGFNIITHISLDERYSAMVGFTRAEVERGVDELLAERPELLSDLRLADRVELLGTLAHYYNGYRFGKRAAEPVYNSDLVLYFLRQLKGTGRYPEQMLDINVRTDYGRLQRIVSLSGAAGAETRALLEAILTEESISSELVEQFGMRTMYSHAQLVSLFYYMGMLTFSPDAETKPLPELVIPNRVIRTLQWEYLAHAIHDQEHVSLDMGDVEAALVEMASRGDIEPLLALFRDKVMARIGVKDQRQFNEGTLKLMMLAYLSNSRIFHVLSEKEFARGYCDLFLALTENARSLRYAWMLEVKYLKTGARPAEIERAFEEAAAQLDRYSSDAPLLDALTQGKELRAGALVFAGAREVQFRPWPPPPGRPTRTPAAKPGKRTAGRKAPAKRVPASKAAAKMAPAKKAPAKKAPAKKTPARKTPAKKKPRGA